MTDLEHLRRTYMRLMKAYPRWYRRERQLELVTTLLDDAVPGQRRPARIDAMNLIGRGLWTRLKPPARIGAWGVCLLAALFMALGAASMAVIPYNGPPAGAAATEIALIAMGRSPDQMFSQNEPPMRIDNVVLHYSVPAERVPAVMTQARYRLASAGWRVDPPRTDGYQGFSATTGRLNISVFSAPDATFDISVSKRVSAVTMVGVAVAGLGGLLAGWLTGVSATQRYRRHQPARRKHIRETAIPFFLSATFLIVMTFQFAALDAADGIDPADIQAPLVFVTFPIFGWFFTAASVLFGLTALGLTAPTRLPPGQPAGPPRPAAPSLT